MQCELASGHPPPHATEIGFGRLARLVTWKHDADRAAAEVVATMWRLRHERPRRHS
jgi:hypothetical protein